MPVRLPLATSQKCVAPVGVTEARTLPSGAKARLLPTPLRPEKCRRCSPDSTSQRPIAVGPSAKATDLPSGENAAAPTSPPSALMLRRSLPPATSQRCTVPI